MLWISIMVLLCGACATAQKTQESLFFEKRLVLPINREELWSALTSEDELGQWWNKGVKLEAKEGGLFYEPWGNDQLATGQVLSFSPRKYIEFTWKEKSWNSSQVTICRFVIKKHGESSILVVTHSGWEVFENQKEIMDGFAKGWDFFLGKLKKYIKEKKT